MKIKVLQAPVSIREYTGQDGQPRYITVFTAQKEDGTVMPICETFGDRRKVIETAMAMGGELEIEKLEFNERFNKWNVRIPTLKEQQQREAPQQKKLYQGSPITRDLFWNISGEALWAAVRIIRNTFNDGGLPSNEVILAEARSLVAQFWMEVERNVVSLGESTSGTEHPETHHKQEDISTSAIRKLIAEAETPEQFEGIKEAINASEIDSETKSELHLECFKKRQQLHP